MKVEISVIDDKVQAIMQELQPFISTSLTEAELFQKIKTALVTGGRCMIEENDYGLSTVPKKYQSPYPPLPPGKKKNG